ncbi:unnamed protein product [Vitrella brassicaformis CCMP3155]|uniref:Uncharacterized protein n=1 Tax=Vitrella brassicaformis (strain CCMP3155) TaxID=1169540 RepID=A0A0G4FFQ6_VITBC|nr:unnamed protein product [Vitrella brassicaformis CCMP3155]|eukprot:CEM11877.1 unnamed protein product [Vitrella brassicaformis CCMP3155]
MVAAAEDTEVTGREEATGEGEGEGQSLQQEPSEAEASQPTGEEEPPAFTLPSPIHQLEDTQHLFDSLVASLTLSMQSAAPPSPGPVPQEQPPQVRLDLNFVQHSPTAVGQAGRSTGEGEAQQDASAAPPPFAPPDVTSSATSRHQEAPQQGEEQSQPPAESQEAAEESPAGGEEREVLSFAGADEQYLTELPDDIRLEFLQRLLNLFLRLRRDEAALGAVELIACANQKGQHRRQVTEGLSKDRHKGGEGPGRPAPPGQVEAMSLREAIVSSLSRGHGLGLFELADALGKLMRAEGEVYHLVSLRDLTTEMQALIGK